MTAKALHYLVPNVAGDGKRTRRAACGRVEILDGRLDRRTHRLELTADWTIFSAENVDHRPRCKPCLEVGHEELRLAAKLRSLIAPAVHASKPTSQIGHAPAVRSILADSLAGRAPEPGPRWASVEGATEHYVRVILDGAPMRGVDFEPDRIRSTALGVPVPASVAGRDDIISYEMALGRAARTCESASQVGRIGVRADLPAAAFAYVFLRCEAGEPVDQQIAPNRKGRVWRCVARERVDVVEALRVRGYEVSEHEVGIVHDAMKAALMETLRVVESLRPARAARPRRQWDPCAKVRTA